MVHANVHALQIETFVMHCIINICAVNRYARWHARMWICNKQEWKCCWV